MKMTHEYKQSQGFTAVELLITLFVAALFLMAGYTLYDTILGRSSDTRQMAQADNIAYDYLRRYEPTIATPCVASTPRSRAIVSTSGTEGLANPLVTVQISCPLSTVPRVSKIMVKVEYGDGGNQRSVQHEIFASEQ